MVHTKDTQLIQRQIESHLQGVKASVSSSDGVHFSARVVGGVFAGHSRVAQQRMVYQAISHWIESGDIHAISISTSVEDE